MARKLESPLTSLGAGLCLHMPGCCPASSICSIAIAKEIQLRAPTQPKAFLGGGDATGLRAMKILFSAPREFVDAEQALPVGQHHGVSEATAAAGKGAAKSTTAAPYPRGAVLGLSMKRSLRRFLKKRVARHKEASPSPYSTAAKFESTCYLW